MDGALGDDAVPLEAIRRRGTFSSRGGEDYGTDEEDTEVVNPTLISFDVDTTEVTNEQPAGVWSAELRPSFGGEARPAPENLPRYETNPLTVLPSVLAGDSFARFVAHLACVPMDATVLRGLAKAFAQKRGLSCSGMFTASFFNSASMTARGLGNILGLEIIKLLILSDTWAIITVFSQWLHVTEEEFLEMNGH